jgi:hypothetical protein
VPWRRIAAVNSIHNWVTQTVGVAFVDPKSWVDDWDYGIAGLHINRRGVRHLSHLYCRVCGNAGGRQKMRSE